APFEAGSTAAENCTLGSLDCTCTCRLAASALSLMKIFLAEMSSARASAAHAMTSMNEIAEGRIHDTVPFLPAAGWIRSSAANPKTSSPSRPDCVNLISAPRGRAILPLDHLRRPPTELPCDPGGR